MKSFFSLLSFIMSLLLFAETIAAARKDGGEYWRAVMKHQPMPDALRELVQIEAATAGCDDETKYNTPEASIEFKEEKIIVENFERPIRPKGVRESFNSDFEPRPSATAYGDDDVGLKGETKSFATDFETMSKTWVHQGNDAGLIKGMKNSYTSDFEPRPSATAYGHDDVGLTARPKGVKKSFISDFEPRPSATAYGQ